MLPSLYGEKADLLVRLEDKLRNEDKGSVEMSFVHLARFFGNASKHYTTSLSFRGVPNGLSGWIEDVAIRVATLSMKVQ
jgi:hypothetical protein